MTAKAVVSATIVSLGLVATMIIVGSHRDRAEALRVSPALASGVEAAIATVDAAADAPVSAIPGQPTAASEDTPSASSQRAPAPTKRRDKARAVSRSGCDDWRPLSAGPSVRSTDVSAVRSCEGPPPSVKRVAQASPERQPNRPRHRSTLVFVTDLGAPR